MLIIPSSWGSQLGGYLPASSIFFPAPLPGKKKTSARGVSHAQSFTLLFVLLYFCLHLFIKNTKKLASLVVVISLLLVHYVLP
jgi:hypothetical protein